MACQLGVLHQVPPIKQKVVVVEHMLLLFGVHVGTEQAFQRTLPFGAPGVDVKQEFSQWPLAVDGARVNGQAGGLLRKALVRLRQAQFLAHQVHQVFGVSAVDDGECWRQADARRVVAQQARADGVEGPGPGKRRWGPGRRPTQRLLQCVPDPPLHVLRSTARKRQQQQTLRVVAGEHQGGHARSQRHGLAAARAGNDQQRGVLGRSSRQAVLRCLTLLRVQLTEGGEPWRRCLRNIGPDRLKRGKHRGQSCWTTPQGVGLYFHPVFSRWPRWWVYGALVCAAGEVLAACRVSSGAPARLRLSGKARQCAAYVTSSAAAPLGRGMDWRSAGEEDASMVAV